MIEADALARLALLAHDLAHLLELLCHALVGGDDLVEAIGDLAGDAGLVARQANREIADAHRLEGVEQNLEGPMLAGIVAVGALVIGLCDREARRLGGRSSGGRLGTERCVRLAAPRHLANPLSCRRPGAAPKRHVTPLDVAPDSYRGIVLLGELNRNYW